MVWTVLGCGIVCTADQKICSLGHIAPRVTLGSRELVQRNCVPWAVSQEVICLQIWRLTSGLWCPFCPAEEDKGIDGLLNLSSLLTDISHHPGDSPVSTNCLQNRAPREGKPPCPHSHWALDRCSARPPSFPTFPCTPDPFPGSCYRTLALRLVLTLLSLHLAVP